MERSDLKNRMLVGESFVQTFKIVLSRPEMMLPFYRTAAIMTGFMIVGLLFIALPLSPFLSVFQAGLVYGFLAAVLGCYLSAVTIATGISMAIDELHGVRGKVGDARAAALQGIHVAMSTDFTAGFPFAGCIPFACMVGSTHEIISQYVVLHESTWSSFSSWFPALVANSIATAIASVYTALALRKVLLGEISAITALRQTHHDILSDRQFYGPAVLGVGIFVMIFSYVLHLASGSNIPGTGHLPALRFLCVTIFGVAAMIIQTIPYVCLAEKICEADPMIAYGKSIPLAIRRNRFAFFNVVSLILAWFGLIFIAFIVLSYLGIFMHGSGAHAIGSSPFERR
jgi:hypothetical protein